MKRQVVFVLVALTLLVGLVYAPTTANAATTTTVTAKVFVFRLRVRDAASMQGKVIAVLRHNQVVTVLGRSAKGSWIKIQTSTNVTGWVSARFVRLTGGTFGTLPAVQ